MNIPAFSAMALLGAWALVHTAAAQTTAAVPRSTPAATERPAPAPQRAQPQRREAPAAAQRQVRPVVVEPATPLTEDELAVAEQVHVGQLRCELGNSVRLVRDEQNPGYFRLQMHQMQFHMRPVISRTGAVRLEDRGQGAVWIQLANKSMLMSQAQGRRLADECAGDEQRAVAEAMRLNPPPSLLEPAPAR